MQIQVVNPLCFMIQKVLIQKYRKPPKQAQDLLYVYDTIELFGAQLDEFKKAWHSEVKHELKDLSDKVQQASIETFSSVNDVIREAASIPQNRKLTPEHLQQTCKYAFEEIFAA